MLYLKHIASFQLILSIDMHIYGDIFIPTHIYVFMQLACVNICAHMRASFLICTILYLIFYYEFEVLWDFIMASLDPLYLLSYLCHFSYRFSFISLMSLWLLQCDKHCVKY